MSRTWYCGVGDETHGEVPAPPLELWLPCTQQRECSLEHGRVAATDAFPPQQNSVPMPTQGSDCRSRQVSFLLRSLLASACSTTCSDERSLYCRLQDVTDKIMNASQRKCSARTCATRNPRTTGNRCRGNIFQPGKFVNARIFKGARVRPTATTSSSGSFLHPFSQSRHNTYSSVAPYRRSTGSNKLHWHAGRARACTLRTPARAPPRRVSSRARDVRGSTEWRRAVRGGARARACSRSGNSVWSRTGNLGTGGRTYGAYKLSIRRIDRSEVRRTW
jgi:hypothetical protein